MEWNNLIIWSFHWFNGKLLMENQHFKEEIHQIGGFSIVILVFGGVPSTYIQMKGNEYWRHLIFHDCIEDWRHLIFH